MIVYSENGTFLGSTRASICGCMTELVVTAEPWRTMILNTLTDYALKAPFGNEGYRIDQDTNTPGRWVVKAQSTLEDGLMVDVAEVIEDVEGRPTLSLLRIRPQYQGRSKRHRVTRK